MKGMLDLFVVGGGPAGLAAAIAARKKGLQVAVADGGQFPIEKACGEGLMPGTVELLRELGVEFHASDGVDFRGVRFIDRNKSVQARFPAGPGLGMRRCKLHERLAEAAENAGATLLWNCPVTELRCDGVRAGRTFFYARWVIGADGFGSRVAHWSGLKNASRGNFRFARQQHFSVKPWSDYVEVYWGARSQAYVTPVSQDEICVAMLTNDAHARLPELLLEHEHLVARVGMHTASTIERGGVTGTQRLRRVSKGNILLIGDASGSVDAITGEGLRLGFEQAIAAVDAIVSGDLSAYEWRHRQIGRRPSNMAALLQLLDAKPGLRERVFRIFGEVPSLFEKAVAHHIGESSLRQTIAAVGSLGWRLFLT